MFTRKILYIYSYNIIIPGEIPTYMYKWGVLKKSKSVHCFEQTHLLQHGGPGYISKKFSTFRRDKRLVVTPALLLLDVAPYKVMEALVVLFKKAVHTRWSLMDTL